MKKMKRVALEKALSAALNGAAEPATATAAAQRVGRPGTPQAMSVVMSPFDRRVDEAEKALAKARAAGEEYAVTMAREELRQARYARTAMKMVAAENARERDPVAASQALRGQGVPLVTNRHQLGADPGVMYA